MMKKEQKENMVKVKLKEEENRLKRKIIKNNLPK